MSINKEDIINQLESYRNENGYSQDKMSKLCGMKSKSTYNEIIKKGRSISVDYLINLANNSDFSLTNFFSQFENSNNQSIVKEGKEGYGKVAQLEERVKNMEELFQLMKLSKDIDEFLHKWELEDIKMPEKVNVQD